MTIVPPKPDDAIDTVRLFAQAKNSGPCRYDYSLNMTPDATICAVRSVSFPRFTSVGLT